MAALTKNPITWTHEDSDPKASMALAFDAKTYLARANGTTAIRPDRVRLVRALAIATHYAVENARVVGVIPNNKDGITALGSEVRGDLFASPEHCYAASTIARTWMLFPDPGRYTVFTATTRDGAPAKFATGVDPNPKGEAGFPPLLLAAVLIVAVVAWSAAVCYVAQVTAEVVDRKLTEDTLTTRMLSTQARAVAIVDTHSERERAAGHALPWSPEELRVLDELLGTQKAIAARTNSPLPNPFTGALEKVEEAGVAAAGAAGGIGMIAVLLGGAYVLTR
ncbi:MAG: hypothetical protein ABJE95_19530 [Byssovorax sp.]